MSQFSSDIGLTNVVIYLNRKCITLPIILNMILKNKTLCKVKHYISVLSSLKIQKYVALV